MKKPSILYLTPCWPHAKSFGSQMRVLHIARALAEIGDLELAIADSAGGDQAAMEKTRSEFEVHCAGSIRSLPDGPLSERWRRVINPRVANPHQFVADEALKRAVSESLDRFDVIWASHLRTVSAFDRWRWPRSVMDIDDVPSTFERSVAISAPRFKTRLRARWQAWVWQRRERVLGERFTVLGVSSESDKRYLGAVGPIHVLPNGFDRPSKDLERQPTTPPRLGFIGQFDYRPNSEGVDWFLRECWPNLKRHYPDLRLRLAGKGTDTPLKVNAPDVDGLGWIADAADEIATWSAMVVPVRFGAGTRLKVLEAFSRKCPVVTTRLGAFGYSVSHGTELLFADRAEDFTEACLRILRDRARAAAMAERAWARFLKEWTWDSMASRARAAVEDCIDRSRAASTAFPGGAKGTERRVSGCAVQDRTGAAEIVH